MESEFRERLQRLLAMSEQTLAMVRRLELVEAESLTRKRINALEDRIDALEDSSEFIFCSYLRHEE